MCVRNLRTGRLFVANAHVEYETSDLWGATTISGNNTWGRQYDLLRKWPQCKHITLCMAQRTIEWSRNFAIIPYAAQGDNQEQSKMTDIWKIIRPGAAPWSTPYLLRSDIPITRVSFHHGSANIWNLYALLHIKRKLIVRSSLLWAFTSTSRRKTTGVWSPCDDSTRLDGIRLPCFHDQSNITERKEDSWAKADLFRGATYVCSFIKVPLIFSEALYRLDPYRHPSMSTPTDQDGNMINTRRRWSALPTKPAVY